MYLHCKYKMKRKFDAKLWKTGNAIVITVPSTIIKRFKLKNGDFIEVALQKDDKKKTD